MSDNPWLSPPRSGEVDADDHATDRRIAEDPLLGAAIATTGPEYPPLSVPSGQPGYPVERVAGQADLWILGLHGGAGSSTVERLLTNVVHLNVCEIRAWPQLAQGGRANVLLVARTHGVGLEALRTAERQWASGDLQQIVSLVGTVLVADGPRPHRSMLVEIKKTVANSPKTWHLGWNEDWRSLGRTAPRPPRTRDSLTASSIVRRLNSVTHAAQDQQHHPQKDHQASQAGASPAPGRSAQAAG